MVFQKTLIIQAEFNVFLDMGKNSVGTINQDYFTILKRKIFCALLKFEQQYGAYNMISYF